MNGRDAAPVLLTDYRKRPPEPPAEGRLGGRAWSLGRGAAPPKFGRGAAPPELPRPAPDIQGGGSSDPGGGGHEH